jgi:hypothetical protein
VKHGRQKSGSKESGGSNISEAYMSRVTEWEVWRHGVYVNIWHKVSLGLEEAYMVP